MLISTRFIVVLCTFAILNGCANMSPAPKVVSTDSRACYRNFFSSGSAMSFKGSTFTSSALVPGVAVKTAMDRASKQIALDGLTITTLDREAGLIAASHKVIAGKGETAPQIVTFESTKGGVQIGFKFITGFGLISDEDAMRETWCKIIAVIEKK